MFEYVAGLLLKLVRLPVGNEMSSENYRKVFSLALRMKHFTLNLLLELQFN